jgi:hypothetical protein
MGKYLLLSIDGSWKLADGSFFKKIAGKETTRNRHTRKTKGRMSMTE